MRTPGYAATVATASLIVGAASLGWQAFEYWQRAPILQFDCSSTVALFRLDGALPKYGYHVRVANVGTAPITIYKLSQYLQFPEWPASISQGGGEMSGKTNEATRAGNPKLPLRLEPADVFVFNYAVELAGWTYDFKEGQEYPARCVVLATTTAGEREYDQYVQLIYLDDGHRPAQEQSSSSPVKPRIGPALPVKPF
jgi:hypothetical protein